MQSRINYHCEHEGNLNRNPFSGDDIIKREYEGVGDCDIFGLF